MTEPLASTKSLETANDASARLKVSVGVFRRWAWKVDAHPLRRERWYKTRRGKRLGLVALYTANQVSRIAQAMKERKT